MVSRWILYFDRGNRVCSISRLVFTLSLLCPAKLDYAQNNRLVRYVDFRKHGISNSIAQGAKLKLSVSFSILEMTKLLVLLVRELLDDMLRLLEIRFFET